MRRERRLSVARARSARLSRAAGVIYDPPRRLFLRGPRPQLLVGPCIAIVGARACLRHGAQVARAPGRSRRPGRSSRRARPRCRRRGPPGALEACGSTVAVLGCGIDRDYPQVHAGLARRIAETSVDRSRGARSRRRRRRFLPQPDRRRPLSRRRRGRGEGAPRALITAEFALEEGREVLAVPGEITSAPRPARMLCCAREPRRCSCWTTCSRRGPRDSRDRSDRSARSRGRRALGAA